MIVPRATPQSESAMIRMFNLLKPGHGLILNHIINNFNMDTGVQVFFGAGPPKRPAALAPRAMRVSKRKREDRKDKIDTIKAKNGMVSSSPANSSMLKSGLM